MERRRFLVKAGGALVAAGAAVAVDAPNVIAQPSFNWRLAHSFPPSADVLDGGAKRFARIVEEMTGGRLKIQVFAGGELIPAFGVFDAASQGTLDTFMSASYYWAGKEPATQWFTAMPFGMNAQTQYAWYYHGGGLQLWEETYAPFDLVPRPGISTGHQMGGWFKRKINGMADLKGLKFRIPGLGGKAYAKAGVTVVLTPGGEIFPALERGVIDGTEWVGPHDDTKFGLHKAAKYYYFPGWHEPGTTGEFAFSKKAYDKLPKDFQRILDYAAQATALNGLAEYETKNAIALEKLKAETKGKVEILQFPAEVVRGMRKLAAEVVKEEAEKPPIAKKVHASYTKFQALISDWADISEAPYHQLERKA